VVFPEEKHRIKKGRGGTDNRASYSSFAPLVAARSEEVVGNRNEAEDGGSKRRPIERVSAWRGMKRGSRTGRRAPPGTGRYGMQSKPAP
jgi:hypothetical protein